MDGEIEIKHVWGKLGRPTKIELETKPGKTITKQEIRKQVWDFLEDNDLVNFPRPPHKRIPNFKGAAHAGQKLATLEEFKNKNAFKVNPDKPQEEVRYQVLDHKKILLVPTPRLKTGLFNYIDHPGGNTSKEFLRTLASRQGIDNHSRPLSLTSKINVEVVVIGAVAVDRLGHRIGKGEGFADLEFAMGVQLGFITEETLVISTVHDCQVFESLPEEIFGDHDVPVDIIVTPTKIIKIKNRLPKPKGVDWDKLSVDKIKQIPILRKLKLAEESGSKDVLYAKTNDSLRSRSNSTSSSNSGRSFQSTKPDNIEESSQKPAPKKNSRPRVQNGIKQLSETDIKETKIKVQGQLNGDIHPDDAESNKGDTSEGKVNGQPVRDPKKQNRNKNRNRAKGRNREDGNTAVNSKSGKKENGSISEEAQPPNQPDEELSAKGRQNGIHDDDKTPENNKEVSGKPKRVLTNGEGAEGRYDRPMLYIGKIPRSARVTDLKDVLHERGVKAKQLVWKGGRGYAFLYFGDTDDAEELYTKLHDLQLGGADLDVQRQKSKE